MDKNSKEVEKVSGRKIFQMMNKNMHEITYAPKLHLPSVAHAVFVVTVLLFYRCLRMIAQVVNKQKIRHFRTKKIS